MKKKLEIQPSPIGSTPDIKACAKQLAQAYAEEVNTYRREWGLDLIAADKKARGLDIEDFPGYRANLRKQPAKDLSWSSITDLMERDPEAGLEELQRIQDEATQELQSGHRTTSALTGGGRPFDQARYTALNEAFAAKWPPTSSADAALLDMLTESYSSYLYWSDQAAVLRNRRVVEEDFREKQEGHRRPSLITVAKEIDRVTLHAERAQNRFLKTMRALQDLHRQPAVYVASAERITIGGQHVHTDGNGAVHPADRKQ